MAVFTDHAELSLILSVEEIRLQFEMSLHFGFAVLIPYVCNVHVTCLPLGFNNIRLCLLSKNITKITVKTQECSLSARDRMLQDESPQFHCLSRKT